MSRTFSTKTVIICVCCPCVSSSCCQRSFRQVFQPQGLDLISAIQWWRKRVPITPPGTASAAARHVAFAVFEGSFTAEAGLCHDDLPVDLPQWFWGLHNVCRWLSKAADIPVLPQVSTTDPPVLMLATRPESATGWGVCYSRSLTAR